MSSANNKIIHGSYTYCTSLLSSTQILALCICCTLNIFSLYIHITKYTTELYWREYVDEGLERFYLKWEKSHLHLMKVYIMYVK